MCFLLIVWILSCDTKMRWNYVLLLALLAVSCAAEEEDDTNEVSVAPPSINLNINLRKALLKALIELENEENNQDYLKENDSERIVEKASASALSVFTSSEDISATSPLVGPTTEKSEDTSKTLILFQKSQAVQQSPITTLEKEELDPFNDAEQILTSASSSFSVPNTNSLQSDIESRSINKGVSNFITEGKLTTDEFKIKKSEVTTASPPSSTEESEAKAEEVQFFSAPLVAAFTVHQDEQGVPKKVESILRSTLRKHEEENLLQKEPKQNKPEKIQQVDPQLEFQQKQILLEQEILRLNLNLKQQQYLNQQQQELFIRQQQEQLRLRNNAQPFLPIMNPNFKKLKEDLGTEKPVVNQFNQFGQSLPVKPAQPFTTDVNSNNSGVTFISSITYDPLTEAGKLPLNAQILPVKGPINFHSPIIQTTGFQQFHSIPSVTPLVTTFSQIPITQTPQYVVNTQQGKRTFRHEIGTGNYVNNDFNRGFPSFSIQKSIQPTKPQQVNPNFTQNFNTFSLAQPQVNRFFRSNSEGTPSTSQNRYFRSNMESTFRSLNNFQHPENDNYRLSNLLYNSGAFSSKEPEDINIISKVLALNHSGGNQYVSSNVYGRK